MKVELEGIELLEDIARGTGAKVKYESGISVLGRCDYQNKVIYISDDEPYRKKILILAHECGHWLSFLECRKNTSLRRNQREALAYEKGWYLLANLGLSRKYHISKEEWYDLNMPNFNNQDPDTRLAWT